MQANELMAAVDGEWVAAQTRELVEIFSVTMAEAEVCKAYEQMMRGIGLEVDVREVSPGRNNLYARIAGRGQGPALMLNGHLDTIPVGNCPACYREGDRIYGRGSTDMKGGMAAGGKWRRIAGRLVADGGGGARRAQGAEGWAAGAD